MNDTARIIVVDDDAQLTRVLRTGLKSRGYEVRTAPDGMLALETFNEWQPDLVITDLAMPVMDGIQATQAIRRHYDLTEVPILAITAYGDFYSERARDVGCNDVIQKPVEIGKIPPLVAQYVH